MSSTSKSKRLKAKSNLVPKPQCHVMRNWLELPDDLMANILYRVGVIDILMNAQYVCTTWYNLCKDPAMWRVIYIKNHSYPSAKSLLQEMCKDAVDPEMYRVIYMMNRPYPCASSLLLKMCKHAVDRSQGQLVDITTVGFANRELLEYIADRSSQLRRFDIYYGFHQCYDGCPKFLEKFPLLEELNLYMTSILKEDIKGAGRCCPMLRTLKLNKVFQCFGYEPEAEESRNELAIAIGKNLPEIRHLELIGNEMSNIGLQAILDGCRHLESLDLRQCLNIDLAGDLGNKCLESIKRLKLPNDYLKEYPYMSRSDVVRSVVNSTYKHLTDLYYDYVYNSYLYYDDHDCTGDVFQGHYYVYDSENDGRGDVFQGHYYVYDSEDVSFNITMCFKSKSNRRKHKKFKKPLPKAKQQRRVKEQKRSSGFDRKIRERSI